MGSGSVRSFVSNSVILGFTSPRAPRRVCWLCTSVVGAAKASTRLWYVNSVIYRTFERYFSCSWTGNLAPLSESIAKSVSSQMTSSVTGKTGTASPKSGPKGPHVSFSSSGRLLLNLHAGVLLSCDYGCQKFIKLLMSCVILPPIEISSIMRKSFSFPHSYLNLTLS